MSGGFFDYSQSRILDISQKIEEVISRNGNPIPKEDMDSWELMHYKEHPEEAFYYRYPDDVIAKFKEGVNAFKKAYVYAQRIDWLLSGDDGEAQFLERLEEELKELNK